MPPDRMTHVQPAEFAVEARPLAYVSAKTLGVLMDISESTIWDWTRKGHLPKPRKMPSGATRWKWSEVETFIDGAAGSPDDADPILRASRGR
ncbi:helix-turn-helix transcriptional regulator [Alloyangia pacifica]|uniref:Transcriptional regulator, AlpA family n=1 Tax=Alloyangia pacifica TaxID=311180 RepID=A0A1I6QIS6_9RHOB|nr:AlpA family phage regulatory protein [Alloyangia pacifica]SDF90572.1 transcriptional regulator, AlpA family [Alloyangia pacifica]SFS52210.1 transcriptional regulator, AlpA family [Alloyangia pacifica]